MIWNTWIRSIASIKRSLHANLFLVIGFYTCLLLFALVLFSLLFSAHTHASFFSFLPPAWMREGEMSHFLGTDGEGNDLFYRLISAYTMSLVLVLKTTFWMIGLSFLFNYVLYRSKRLGAVIQLFLQLTTLVPPILTVMAIGFFFHHTESFILLAIGFAYLPHFMNDVHHDIMTERDKPYVLADRLEGMSEWQLLRATIFPNIMPNLLRHLVMLMSQILLGMTLITFFRLIDGVSALDLGAFMHEMLSLFLYNPWPIYMSGLLIIITIMSLHFLMIGLEKARLKAIED